MYLAALLTLILLRFIRFACDLLIFISIRHSIDDYITIDEFVDGHSLVPCV